MLGFHTAPVLGFKQVWVAVLAWWIKDLWLLTFLCPMTPLLPAAPMLTTCVVLTSVFEISLQSKTMNRKAAWRFCDPSSSSPLSPSLSDLQFNLCEQRTWWYWWSYNKRHNTILKCIQFPTITTCVIWSTAEWRFSMGMFDPIQQFAFVWTFCISQPWQHVAQGIILHSLHSLLLQVCSCSGSALSSFEESM